MARIDKNGMNQGDLVAMLDSIVAAIAGINAKLDADTGVEDTDYASTWNITDTIDS